MYPPSNCVLTPNASKKAVCRRETRVNSATFIHMQFRRTDFNTHGGGNYFTDEGSRLENSEGETLRTSSKTLVKHQMVSQELLLQIVDEHLRKDSIWEATTE